MLRYFILFIFLSLSKIVAQSDPYFIEENGKAIRDSIKDLKFVNPDKTIKFIFEVLEKYTENRPNLTFGNAYTTLSELYQFKGLHNQTVEYLNLALEEYEELFKEIPPWQKINIANSFYSAEQFNEAKRLYIEAYETFEKKLLLKRGNIGLGENLISGLAVSSNNIALVERRLGNYDLAEIQFQKGLRFRKKNLEWGTIAHSYLNLSLLYYDWDKLDKVQTFSDSSKFALKKFLSLRDNMAEKPARYNLYFGLNQKILAMRSSRLNKKKESFIYFDSAEDYLQNNLVNLSDVIYSRVEATMKDGDLEFALSSINKGLQLAEKAGFFNDQRRYLKKKSELLALMENYKDSKEVADKLLMLNEKNLATQNKDIFTNVTLKVSLRKKEKLLLIEGKIRQRLIFSFLLIFLILGMIIFIFRNKNIISKQKAVISKKDKKIAEVNLMSSEKELRYVTKSILEKNEMLKSIKKDVNYVSKFVSESPELKHAINPLVLKLEDATSENNDWSKFQYTFKKAYPGFIEQFSKTNSTLSVQDLRLSIYLRSGHTTKEIANLTGLSVRSIESRRHRLRKKLDLDKETDLITYIMGISTKKSLVSI